MQVIEGLRDLGWDAVMHDPAGPVPDVLILGKRYDQASLQHALQLRSQHGTRVLLDLCDNHFFCQTPEPLWIERATRLRQACHAVDGVVVASAALEAVVRAECLDVHHVTVVEDPLDVQETQPKLAPWKDRLHLARLRWFHHTHRVAQGRRLIWFGNHGADYAQGGMGELACITDALQAHQQKAPISLVVVSNRWSRYRELSRRWNWPSIYLPWSEAVLSQALSRADVALIPTRDNPFTRCKTNNRLATAFLHGVAVAASGLPSYAAFHKQAVLDDWDAGLAHLMESHALRRDWIQSAQDQLQEGFSQTCIARKWDALLRAL